MDNHYTTATENISENDIIARVIKGEKNLYALIVRRYNQRLYRIGMSILNNDAEVEDVMQVAYIKAFENLEQFAFRSSFATWLTRILINESLLRVKKRKQAIVTNEYVADNAMDAHQLAHTQTPLMQVINKELKAAIEVAIQQLPEKYRTVFVMREIENMNVAETKECLDISEVNVKVRLNRAKALLQHSLSGYYKENIFDFHLTRCAKITNAVMLHIEQI